MTWEIFGRLILSLVVGAAIGAERETRGKAAGFRTMTLICFGSTLFTMASTKLTEDLGDPSRVAAQVVTGVGFLGAGAIMRDGPRVSGLTTAATIWITAALGMGIASGGWDVSLTAAVLTMSVLVSFPYVERVIDLRRESESVTIRCAREDVGRFDELVAASGLSVVNRTLGREHSTATLSWTVIGRHDLHVSLVERLFDDPNVEVLTTSR
jgi:putative Mg2+ transporter-C (MgtC) family protein